jgi:hypothetical protein
MAIPFKLDPEPPKRTDDDPFLEFDSERPGVRPKISSHEPLLRPELPEVRSERIDFQMSEPSLGLGQPQRTSAISPAFAFALGVAGPRDCGCCLLPVVPGACDAQRHLAEPANNGRRGSRGDGARHPFSGDIEVATGVVCAITCGGAACCAGCARRERPYRMWRPIRPGGIGEPQRLWQKD